MPIVAGKAHNAVQDAWMTTSASLESLSREGDTGWQGQAG